MPEFGSFKCRAGVPLSRKMSRDDKITKVEKPLIFNFFLTFKSSNLLYYHIVAYYVEQMALDKEFEAQKR